MSELTHYLKEVAKQLEIQNAYSELDRAKQNNEAHATDKFNKTLKVIKEKYINTPSDHLILNKTSLKTLNRVKAIEEKHAKMIQILEKLKKSRSLRTDNYSTKMESLLKHSKNGFKDYQTHDEQYNFATTVAQELEQLKSKYIIAPKEAKNVFERYISNTNVFYLSDRELYNIRLAYDLY